MISFSVSSSLDCPTQQVLLSFLSGSLSWDDSDAIRTHVETCSRCRESVQRLADTSVTTAHSDPDSAEPAQPGEPAFDQPRASLAEFSVGRTESSRTTNHPPDEKKGDTEIAGDGGSASRGSEDETVAAPAALHRIGKYEVVRLVGRGGFADVYLARNPQLDEEVAVKVPRAHLAAGPVTEAFLSEARTAANLRHPNIVSIRDAETDARGRAFVIMDWLEGGTLDDVRKRKQLSVDEIVNIMRQIAQAAAHAHREGFVHRDLKPSNILFDKYGRPHIADFGLAVHERELQKRDPEFAGTRRFMSPEQVRRETALIDRRADVWALGVILYLLLSAEFPFDGDHSQVESAILEGTPKPLKVASNKVPEELQAICMACLRPDLEKRLSSADELANRLETFSRHQARKRTRRKFLISGSALLGLGGAAAYGGYWIYDRNRELRAEEVYCRANSEWSYNWNGQIAFEAYTDTTAASLLWLALGEIESPPHDFRIDLKLGQLNHELGIALVLAHRANQFQSFMTLNVNGLIKVQRQFGEFTDPVGGYYKLRSDDARHDVGPVDQVFRREETISVQVTGGRIVLFQYGNSQCKGVEDSDDRRSIIDRNGYIGRFGIMTTHGEGTIRDLEITA